MGGRRRVHRRRRGRGGKSRVLTQLAGLAARAGLPLAAVVDLDEDELDAYADAVVEARREQAWGYAEELLAEILRVQHATLLAIQRGMPVVQVKKLRSGGGKPIDVKRPAWVRDVDQRGDEVVVTSFRDLRQYLN